MQGPRLLGRQVEETLRAIVTSTTTISSTGARTTLLNPPPEKATAVSGTPMVPPTAVTLEEV